MAGIKGMKQACQGMTDDEVAIVVAKMYSDFCKYRYEIGSKLPDSLINQMKKKWYTGSWFHE